MPKNTIQKRKDGRYSYRATDQAGKRHQIISRKGELKREFSLRCDRLDERCEAIVTELTLDGLFDRWHEEYVTRNLSKSYQEAMQRLYSTHISPYLGSMPVGSIKRADVYGVLLRMDDKGLRPSTISKTRACISSPYSWAINTLGYDLISPTDGLRFSPSNKPESKIRVISDQEMKKFMEAAEGSKYYDYYLVLSLSGLRPSEALGLRVEDIQDEKLLIRRGITLRGESELKTSAARRTIPLTGKLKTILHRLKDESDSWLFPSESGKPSMNAVNTAFKRTVKNTEVWERGGRNGMKKVRLIKPAIDIRLYDFRHTFATKLAEASMPESALTAIMGHESIITTLKYYIGLTDKMKNQAKSILENL